METLTAHIEDILPDQTLPVSAHATRVRTLAKFLSVTPVELPVSHSGFRKTRQKAELNMYMHILASELCDMIHINGK